MRRSEAYWHVGRVVEQLGDIVDEAQSYIDAGDGRHAYELGDVFDAALAAVR